MEGGGKHEGMCQVLHKNKLCGCGCGFQCGTAMLRPLCPDTHASVNPFLSGSADLFCPVDGLLPVLILAFFILPPSCRETDD